MKIGAPMALQYLLMNGAQLVSTMIVAPLGNIAIAAHSFAITAESLCYMPGYGISEAATTLVGQSVGADRRDLHRSFAWMTVSLGMVVMAFMGIVMYIFAPEMIAYCLLWLTSRYWELPFFVLKPLPNHSLLQLLLLIVSV